VIEGQKKVKQNGEWAPGSDVGIGLSAAVGLGR
jgi:hypothetical protein